MGHFELFWSTLGKARVMLVLGNYGPSTSCKILKKLMNQFWKKCYDKKWMYIQMNRHKFIRPLQKVRLIYVYIDTYVEWQRKLISLVYFDCILPANIATITAVQSVFFLRISQWMWQALLQWGTTFTSLLLFLLWCFFCKWAYSSNWNLTSCTYNVIYDV